MCILLYMIMCMLLSATSTHFKWELMLYYLHCPTLNKVFVLFLLYSYSYSYVIKWKHFPRYWPFVRGIHRWPVNSPHKRQWCGALMFSLICTWINGGVNNREAGDLRRHRALYDAIVLYSIHQTVIMEWCENIDKLQFLGLLVKSSGNHLRYHFTLVIESC